MPLQVACDTNCTDVINKRARSIGRSRNLSDVPLHVENCDERGRRGVVKLEELIDHQADGALRIDGCRSHVKRANAARITKIEAV